MKLRSDFRAAVSIKNRLHHESGEKVEEPISTIQEGIPLQAHRGGSSLSGIGNELLRICLSDLLFCYRRAPDAHQTRTRRAQDAHKTRTRRAQDVHKTRTRRAQDTHKTRTRHAQDTHKTHKTHTRHKTAQDCTRQHKTAQDSTRQHKTAQRSTTQHNAAQHTPHHNTHRTHHTAHTTTHTTTTTTTTTTSVAILAQVGTVCRGPGLGSSHLSAVFKCTQFTRCCTGARACTAWSRCLSSCALLFCRRNWLV